MGVFSPLARRVDNARNAVHIIYTIEPATGGDAFWTGFGHGPTHTEAGASKSVVRRK